MFERYTEAARRVLFFARYEASQLGGVAIEADHVLLGLTREAKGIICEIFAGSHVSLKSIRNEIEARSTGSEKLSTSVEIPFSDETKHVLQFAAEEADRLHHNYIGTEHMLLGLLRESACTAAATLTAHGLRLEDVRSDIVKLGETGAVLGLPTHSAEADEHVERIKRLVAKLAETPHEEPEAKELTERIVRELDALKRRLAG
jgi:ATP-dependent Clp protease ATP-binding subunit ClpC